MNPFGPQNGHANTTAPAASSSLRYGNADTWVQDCSAPGRKDGSVLDAGFFNNIIGNLYSLVKNAGITNAVRGDFNLLTTAIRALIHGEMASTSGLQGFATTIRLSLGRGILPTLAKTAVDPTMDTILVWDKSTGTLREVTITNAIYAAVNTQVPQPVGVSREQFLLAVHGTRPGTLNGFFEFISDDPDDITNIAFHHQVTVSPGSILPVTLLAYAEASTSATPPGLGLNVADATAYVASIFAQGLQAASPVTMASPRSSRVVTATGDINVLTSDYYIGVKKTVPGPTNVYLPANFIPGMEIVVKDRLGDAATNNITVIGPIDGQSSYVLTMNGQSETFFYDMNGWSII
jgi:hypothetical protein